MWDLDDDTIATRRERGPVCCSPGAGRVASVRGRLAEAALPLSGGGVAGGWDRRGGSAC